MKQDVQAFRSGIKSKVPPGIADEFLDQAIGAHVQQGKVHRGDYADCIALARCLQEACSSSPSAGSDPEALQRGSMDTEIAVTSNLLYDSLQSTVEDLRQGLFNRSDPPFQAYEDAASWIQKEARCSETSPVDWERLERLRAETERLQQEWSEAIRSPVCITVQRPSLTYAVPESDWQEHACVRMNSPLLPLKDFVGGASRSTGLSEPSLVAHVLTGLRPPLRRLRTTTRLSFPARKLREHTVTICAHNPCREDFVAAYHEVKKDVLWEHRSRLDDIDSAIVQAIQELGGIRHGEEGFWGQVFEKCKQAGVGVRSAGQVRMRHKRLRNKLPLGLLEQLEADSEKRVK